MNVSLYIPAFNAERTIAKCIEAVLSQKYPLKEFLVIDDGSIDKTYDIASNYSLKVLRLDNNYGLAAVRNIALNNLDSDFIAAVDSDCVIKDDWLQRLMAQFSESAVAGAGGKLIEENLDSCFDFWRSVHMPQFWEKDDRDPPFLFGANTVFRKKALLSVGGYDESLKNNYEDVDISRRLKEKGFKLRYDPEARAGHLKKDDFISLLRTYWCWNLPDYQRRNFYLSPKSLKEKIYYNNFVIGSYFAQDLKAKRFDLGYIDLLLFLYLSFQDWLYFFDIYKKEASSFDMMAFILSSLGLTFFYKFDLTQKSFFTDFSKCNLLAIALSLYGFLNQCPIDEKSAGRVVDDFLNLLFQKNAVSIREQLKVGQRDYLSFSKRLALKNRSEKRLIAGFIFEPLAGWFKSEASLAEVNRCLVTVL